MNIEEYKSIRDEMLQRFRWTFEILFFAVASTGALLSWLSTISSQAPSELNPFLFVCVGLGIISFLLYEYLEVLRGIYNQGSYLVVFHERNKQDFRWHTLNRFRKELVGGKSDWGRDGRRGGYLLAVLTTANIGGPLWFLRGNILVFDWFRILTIVIALILVTFLSIIAWNLFHTDKSMREQLRDWSQLRDNLEKDSSILKTIITTVIGN